MKSNEAQEERRAEAETRPRIEYAFLWKFRLASRFDVTNGPAEDTVSMIKDVYAAGLSAPRME